MSDNSHTEAHEEAHTGPVKTPKQLLMAVFASLVIPIFVIIGLVYFITSGNKPAAGSSDMEKSIAERIQKVGSIEIRDANREMKTGMTKEAKLNINICLGVLTGPVWSSWA